MADIHLAAIVAGRQTGVLSQVGGRTSFRYLQDYTGTPLSLSMPVTPGPYPSRRASSWIRGLLPDNRSVLAEWGAQLGVNPNNPVALLSRMGRDCPGAVQFCLPEEVDETLAGHGELIPLSADQVAERVATARQDPAHWTYTGEQWSLAGAQTKFALRQVGGHWFEAHGAEPTTHIVKVGVPGYADHDANEHLCMAAAAKLGLRVAHTDYADFAGERALIVTRFDRMAVGGKVVRIHQEDLCQALGLPPERKYQDTGGPGVAAITDLIKAASSEASLWRFVEAQVYGYLIGATDGHAKYYAMLLEGDRAELAPLFDVASALPYDPAGDNLSTSVAMSIGGEKRIGRVTEHHWARMANRAGVPPERLLARVRELAHDLPDAFADAIGEMTPTVSGELERRFTDRLPDHLKRLGVA